MRNLIVLFIPFIATQARLLGNARSIVVQSLLLKHQLLIVNRSRATIAQSTRIGPDPRRLDGALVASNSSGPSAIVPKASAHLRVSTC